MSYQGTPAVPPLLGPVWDAVVQRLATDAQLQALLGGPYVAAVYQALPANATQTGQWQRLVVVPVTQAWPLPDAPGRYYAAPFNLRADVHMPSNAANPAMKLELLHQRAFALLHGWAPGVLDGAQVRLPLWRETPPTPAPLWDEAGDFAYMTAEYRLVVEPEPLP